MKKDDEYKEKIKNFILDHGAEEAFSFALDLIVNTTEFDTVFMDESQGFIILCKPDSLDQLKLLGFSSDRAMLGYAQEDDDDTVEYPDFNNKDDKVH